MLIAFLCAVLLLCAVAIIYIFANLFADLAKGVLDLVRECVPALCAVATVILPLMRFKSPTAEIDFVGGPGGHDIEEGILVPTAVAAPAAVVGAAAMSTKLPFHQYLLTYLLTYVLSYQAIVFDVIRWICTERPDRCAGEGGK